MGTFSSEGGRELYIGVCASVHPTEMGGATTFLQLQREPAACHQEKHTSQEPRASPVHPGHPATAGFRFGEEQGGGNFGTQPVPSHICTPSGSGCLHSTSLASKQPRDLEVSHTGDPCSASPNPYSTLSRHHV